MKSIKFVKQRIISGYANVPLQNNAKFTELKFDDYVRSRTKEDFQKGFVDNKYQIKYKKCKAVVDSKEIIGDIVANILYDENADFEYFTMRRCTCDGTLLFMDELIQKVFLNVMQIQTVNNDKVPEDFNKNPFDYEIFYTVGNFVLCDEYGEFGTDEKPWLHSRFTVMLPIKFDMTKRS